MTRITISFILEAEFQREQEDDYDHIAEKDDDADGADGIDDADDKMDRDNDDNGEQRDVFQGMFFFNCQNALLNF